MSLYYSYNKTSNNISNLVIISLLLTSTLASKYSTYSIYFIALVAKTFIALYILTIDILYALTKLSISIDYLTLLYLLLEEAYSIKVSYN